MSDVLLVERTSGVLVMTLNRPEARNAINRELSVAVAAALDELDASDDLHAGIVTGAGGTFSSGMDLRAFAAGESIEVEGRGVAGLTRTPPDKPLIAAIEGFALAGGFEIALACDLLVAADDVVLGLPEVRRGLIAGSGGLIRLSRRMPYALAAEYGLTGRRFGAEEAARWGVVNRVVPPGAALSSAHQLAAEIGDSSPFALAATKTVLRAAAELSDVEAWRVQDETLDRVFASDDSREGARAFVEKRPPVWTGR
jgi:enoyl-CoA hydratase